MYYELFNQQRKGGGTLSSTGSFVITSSNGGGGNIKAEETAAFRGMKKVSKTFTSFYI